LLHSSFAALRERRIDHARWRTSHNCFMQRLNPSRNDGGSTPVALKPFELLVF
jgi:hypothetical protein